MYRSGLKPLSSQAFNAALKRCSTLRQLGSAVRRRAYAEAGSAPSKSDALKLRPEITA